MQPFRDVFTDVGNAEFVCHGEPFQHRLKRAEVIRDQDLHPQGRHVRRQPAQEACRTLIHQEVDPEGLAGLGIGHYPQAHGAAAQAAGVGLICAHLRPAPSPPGAGVGAGVRLALGDIVAHSDDDCRFPAGWLTAGVQGFEQNVAFVAGPIYPDTRDPWTFFSFVMWQPKDNGTYPTSNIFYRRDVVLSAGGFDEAFGANLLGRPVWGWDSDFAWQLIRKGYERRFRPDAAVTSHIFKLSPKRWLLEGWRAVMLPGVVRQVPELRRTLLTGRLFHTKDSAAFELGVAGTVAALAAHKPALLLFWAPWMRIAVSYARPDWFPPVRWIRLSVKVVCVFAQHAVYVAALIFGSIKARNPVL